jgi:hypothetical protein
MTKRRNPLILIKPDSLNLDHSEVPTKGNPTEKNPPLPKHQGWLSQTEVPGLRVWNRADPEYWRLIVAVMNDYIHDSARAICLKDFNI